MGVRQRRIRRCQPIWRRPENQRWDRKLSTEVNGEPWNTPPRQEEKKLQIQGEVCISLKRKVRCHGQKDCMACCRHAGEYSQELQTRAQDTVNNEVAHAGQASSIDSQEQSALSLSCDLPTSSSSGTVQAAGRPAPEALSTW